MTINYKRETPLHITTVVCDKKIVITKNAVSKSYSIKIGSELVCYKLSNMCPASWTRLSEAKEIVDRYVNDRPSFDRIFTTFLPIKWDGKGVY